MIQPSRIAKRYLIPLLLAATLVVAVQVVLAAPPAPSFTASAQQAGGCGTFTFTGSHGDPDNDVALTEWDFGDGTFVTGDLAESQTYALPGPQTIRMRVTDATGDTVEATPVSIDVVNLAAPNALFTVTGTRRTGQTITFNASTSNDSGGPIASYAWDFNGDDVYGDKTGQQVTEVYTTSGDKTVGLQVRDGCNVAATREVSFEIDPPAPQASFTITPTRTPEPNTNVTFTSTSTEAASITLYEWDLDDDGLFNEPDVQGETNAATVTHPYPSAGPVTARLRVSAGGPTSTATETFRVNRAPVPRFTRAPNPALIGEQVNFDAGDSDDDAGITSYAWDLDGDGVYNEAGVPGEVNSVATTHTYSQAADLVVGVRVTDTNNIARELRLPLKIQLTRPNPGLLISPRDPLPGEPVTLTSTSTASVTAGAPALATTEWDFDYQPLLADFTLDATGDSIVTSFATPGPKTIAVKAVDAGSGFAIASDTIVVNAPPRSSFTVAPAKPIESREVTFASTSSDPDGPITNQEWDLDNDNKYERAGAVVSTKKLKKGTRTIRLRVTDSKGATSTTAVPVKVAAKPLKGPVRVQRRIGFARRSWGIQLVALLVKVPSQTTVTVKCTGRGCPKGAFKKRTKKKAGTLRFDKLHGAVRAGAKITVVSAHTGHVTAYDTYIVRGGERGPLLREQCKLPGKKKPQRCPKR